MAIKKTTKKVAPARQPKAVEVKPAAPCMCGSGCRCRGGHFFKKLIVLLIVFAAGFAVCHFGCCKKGFPGKKLHMSKHMFVEGCLDVSKIRHQKMVEKMVRADLDGDGCITKEELRSLRKERHGADMAEQREENHSDEE